ncbi:DHH family phosphoesterase [Arcticibacterium luteifluviistationis]|uniref:DHH family phosphoesterase n=1 Tax=Arcticibacterium luteifluviistationis TaxID=1784714 RepID=A0A2Z4GEQ5_9BACT|nr:bifunctional oligoribonuclease/PAP phosphatase NrnA [Arcticibacterium luteifluviistationis]AWV99822.1 DHH family phosphoesterase [Arcticibacterium luteifluviistationis]
MHQYFTDNQNQKDDFLALLKGPKNIVLTAHQNPDGDAFGSSLGLLAFLKQLNHNVTVISPTDHADYLAWMPGVNEVLDFQNNQHLPTAKKLIEEADIIFCLDFSSLGRLGAMEENFRASSALMVLIDHHQEPESFADYVFWNEKAAATCELIYLMIEELGLLDYVNEDVATCLYTGILTDTGSFKFDSTSITVHRIAGELIDKGINPNSINRKLFDQNSIDRLRFLGFALKEKLNYLEEFRVAYFYFSKEELEEYNSKKGDTEGLVNYGLSISGAVMSAIFIERDGIIKISFRSVDDFSVSEFSRNHFSGGGHRNAAGGKSDDNLESTVKKFLELLPTYKEKLTSQPE